MKHTVSARRFLADSKSAQTLVYKVEAFKDGDDIFIEPSTIVPMPVSRFVSVGKSGKENQPWASDRKTWHLEKRCSPKSKEMLLVLDQVLQDEWGNSATGIDIWYKSWHSLIPFSFTASRPLLLIGWCVLCNVGAF